MEKRVIDLIKTANEYDELADTLYKKYADNETAIAEAKSRGSGNEVQNLRSNRENIKELINLLNSVDSEERQIEKSIATEEKLSKYDMTQINKLRDDLGITNQDLEELDGAEYRNLSTKKGLIDAIVEYSVIQESEREEARNRELNLNL